MDRRTQRDEMSLTTQRSWTTVFRQVTKFPRGLQYSPTGICPYHRHRGIRMVTPGQRYRGEDAEVLRRRRETMLEARRRHPERWITGRVLNCTPIKEVWLNPENGQLEEKHAKAA